VPVPPEVDVAILRGLEPDREDRWPDMQSFVDALADVAPGAPATRYPRGRAPRPSTAGAAGLPAAVLLALCVVVALAMFGASYAVVEMLQ
jgi:hypothetical protein